MFDKQTFVETEENSIHPTHIYTTAHVPGFWYFILYTQHTYTQQHTFLVLHPLHPTHIYTTAHVPGTSSSTPNTHIHDSTRSWYFILYTQHTYTRQHTFLVLHPLHPTHIYTTAHVPCFWYFILYSQHTYTRQHTFLVSGTSSSTPNTHIHDSTRSWFLVLHPLHPTHIYTTAHVPGFWYFILYTQHTYTQQHTFLVSGTSPSTPNTHIHDSTRSLFLILHPLHPTHIYTTAHVPGF